MTLLLFIVGLLLIALGWCIGTRPESAPTHDDADLYAVGEGALAVFAMFVGVLFAAIAALSGLWHWLR